MEEIATPTLDDAQRKKPHTQFFDDSSERKVVPQSGGAGCGCGGGNATSSSPPAFVYALGRMQPRFPGPGVEREFAQVRSMLTDTQGLTDAQVQQTILSRREYRYLARRMCWVLSVEGLDTYLVVPRDPQDLDLLIDSLRQRPRARVDEDLDLVVGVRGPIAPPEACGGLQLPILVFEQLYSFDVETLLKAIPLPEGVSAEQFRKTAEELFLYIMQLADNAGGTDEHRAINYLSVRYPAIYVQTAEAQGKNCSLTSVDVRPSRLSGTRKIVDVIFTYTSRTTGVTEQFFTRVDVTDAFPFIVTGLNRFFER